MKVIVTTEDESGESHFEDREVSFTLDTFAPPAAAFEVSGPHLATALLFFSLPAGWDDVVHPSPRCQTLIGITGTIRVTVSDGEAWDIRPGDVWRMEDTSGKGYYSVVVSNELYLAAIVQHA